jgi:large subunit ribosomal protein LP0
MIMGKNTLMKSCINHLMTKPEEDDEDYEERKDTWKARPELDAVVRQLKGNTGIIFHNGDLTDLKDILDAQVREAPARVGSIAPDDVFVKSGPTGLDPKQTSFFQNLSIQTKIVKGQVEIVNDVQVVFSGEKVTSSQASLLDKLKIKPFFYKMEIKMVYDKGELFAPGVLSIKHEDILTAFSASIANLTSLSLSSGYITKSAAPHLMINAFKNLCSVSFASDYSFPAADRLKEAAKNTVSVAATATKADDKPVEKEEEPEEEEELDADCGNLFGDDDDY